MSEVTTLEETVQAKRPSHRNETEDTRLPGSTPESPREIGDEGDLAGELPGTLGSQAGDLSSPHGALHEAWGSELSGSVPTGNKCSLLGGPTEAQSRMATSYNRPSLQGEAIDCVAPTMAVLRHLDNILNGQFGESDVDRHSSHKQSSIMARSTARATNKSSRMFAEANDVQSSVCRESGGSKLTRQSTFKKHLQGGNPDAAFEQEMNRDSSIAAYGQEVSAIARFVESSAFAGFFMLLTFYALFVPDIDLMFGNKESQTSISIVTTVVVVAFLFEIVSLSAGRPKYVGRAYFWLDIVALVSLLPDTYIVQQIVLDNNAFVAGRSSKLTRLIRVASRSAKAMKFQRLTRLIRVASLIPKIKRLVSRRVADIEDDETDMILEKKLRRVFLFLDEDLDGLIPRSAVNSCLVVLKSDMRNSGGTTTKIRNGFGNVIQMAKQGLHRTGTGASTPKSLNLPRTGTGASSLTSPSLPRSGTAVSSPKSHTSAAVVGEATSCLSRGSTVGKTFTSKSGSSSSIGMGRFMGSGGSQVYPEPSGAAMHHMGSDGPSIETLATQDSSSDLALPPEPSSPLAAGMPVSHASSIRSIKWQIPRQVSPPAAAAEDEGAEVLVNYEEFRNRMLEDPDVCGKLRTACQNQLRNRKKRTNFTTTNTEYIAVKVALGVLLLLFVLGIVETDVKDLSGQQGLQHMEELVKLRIPGNALATEGDPIPDLFHEQVCLWSQGVGFDPVPRDLIYLDLQRKVYCNEIAAGGQPCHPNSLERGRAVWGARVSVDEVDRAIVDSHFRFIDVIPITVPAVDLQDLSSAEVNNHTTSVAIIAVRGQVQYGAGMSFLTTLLVMMIILGGIGLLTKDMAFLGRNLLKPLRELAEDMDSIAQMQLAGVAAGEEAQQSQGTSEIRLIRRTFENMKKAIKSWGKYVPWPVVQILLRAKVEASLEVNEAEVTIFFSDIANFTTHVESMRPESSLLLLSRYFNDMSKIIDDHGGVVLEFIGDAILCIYGAPLQNPDHATAAVRASLRMLNSLKRMNEWSAARGLPHVSIRCGVHTGRVLVGNMGFNARMKYDIIGEEAEVAGKLEEMNKNYETNMLISQRTFDSLTGDFITRPIDYLILHKKATKQIVEAIHEVIDRVRGDKEQHDAWPACALHAEAMALFRQRQFETALPLFERVGRMMQVILCKPDQASAVMAKRCKSYINQPPAADWEGVWDRGDK